MASRSNSIILQDVPPKTRSKKTSISSQVGQPGETPPKLRSQKPSEIVLQVPTQNTDRKPRKESNVRNSVPAIPEDKELDFSKREGSRYASNNSISNASTVGSQYRSANPKYNRQNGGGIVNNGYIGSTPSISSSGPLVQNFL